MENFESKHQFTQQICLRQPLDGKDVGVVAEEGPVFIGRIVLPDESVVAKGSEGLEHVLPHLKRHLLGLDKRAKRENDSSLRRNVENAIELLK